MTRTTEVGGIKVQGSEEVIPAVRGEFYAYETQLTSDRSIYALLKCKSNKARPLGEAKNLGRNANLLFMFGDKPQISTVKAAAAFGLLGDDAQNDSFDETRIALTGITAEEFYGIYSRKDTEALVKAGQMARLVGETSLQLEEGMVVAMMTADGKNGLFIVKVLTPSSAHLDACHILL